MAQTTPQTALRSFMYGGGATLLTFDLFFLAKALWQDNFIPIVPIIAGILTAGGLLLIVYSEHSAREKEKRDHRRLSRVAHQLESPLHALQEDLEELIRKADTLPADYRLKIKHMETKTKVLLENVRDVFLTLQAQEGPIVQERRVYDLCVLVQEAVARGRPVASAHNVQLVEKMHCSHAPVEVDRRLFLIAAGHLLENSILYTMTPGLVNITVLRGEKFARVVIQDRGIGIHENDVGAVFQPFARGMNASKFDPDGIGVGLTLTRLIMRELGGSIRWKLREHEGGTQFELRLPLVKN